MLDRGNVIGRVNYSHFGMPPDHRADLGAARLGHILGCFTASAPGTGRVRTGTEIVVLPQTVRAKVKLVNLAMDHRRIPVTNVAAATDPSG